MTETEINTLAVEAASSNDAANRLWLEMEPHIVALSKSRRRSGSDYGDDETRQSATHDAFMRSIRGYDPTRSNFRQRLVNLIFFEWRHPNNHRQSRRPLPQFGQDESGRGLENLVPDCHERESWQDMWESERDAAVRDAVENLPEPQREAVRLVFLEQRTMKDSAAELGVCRYTLLKRYKEGFLLLKPVLAPFDPNNLHDK